MIHQPQFIVCEFPEQRGGGGGEQRTETVKFVNRDIVLSDSLSFNIWEQNSIRDCQLSGCGFLLEIFFKGPITQYLWYPCEIPEL